MPYIFTNKYNLPEVFVEALKLDTHVVNGDISVTQLLNPPKIQWLLDRNEIEIDVSDRLQMLFGTAMHSVMERAEVSGYAARKLIEAAVQLSRLNTDEHIILADRLRMVASEEFPGAFNDDILIENTLSVKIETSLASIVLSGTVDKIIKSEKKIQDYKNTTVFNYIYEENKKKWYAQLNIYAFMARENGIDVETADVIAFFKDYNASKKKNSKNYPEAIAMEIPMKMYPHDKVGKTLVKKAELHLQARNTEDYNLVPDCTKKDRWYKTGTWAAVVPGLKKSKRVSISENLIDQYVKDNKLKYPTIKKEYRAGDNIRCENYCPVKNVCPQRKEWNELYKKNH